MDEYQSLVDNALEFVTELFPWDLEEEIKTEPVKYSSPIVMEVEDVEEAELGDTIEFDWKQAIISKEILDRKYI